MSSLAATVNAHANPPVKDTMKTWMEPNPFQQLTHVKTSNQDMETYGADKLRWHLEESIKEKENDDDPEEGEISFRPSHSVFQLLSLSQALVAQDLCTPDLLCIFWASICISLPTLPSNMMDMMFDVLDEFITKMKDANQCCMVFLHKPLHYGTLTNHPSMIEEPEYLSTKADKWSVYFPQAKPQFQGGDNSAHWMQLPLGKNHERTRWLV